MDYEGIVPNELLIRARHQQGWTQADLAGQVGTTFETVSRWERGIIAPSAYYRRKLCQVFNKTAKEIGLDTTDADILLPTPGPSTCVFLSSTYADAEHKFVVSLKKELTVRGVTLWSSRTVKRQAPNRKRDVLQEAIHTAQLVLLIVSSNTQASHHVQETLRLARHYKRPVCAVWIEGESLQACLPKDYGELNAMIDAREGEDHFLRTRIITTIERIWLTPSAPASAGLSEPMWKVPGLARTLIGREELLASLCELLRGSQVRLLTLLGPGGIGKTHLALQLAMEMRERFVDGICFVSLAAVSDCGLVISAIAKELGIKEVGDQPLLDQMKVALRSKHLLLLLDNFEHVLEASSQLPELLAACSHLKIVVTSRTRLHVAGEEPCLVPPLTLPDLALPLEPETLSQNAAIALFLDRARTARPDFHMTPTNAHAIAEICIRLDGLPLAIELAAARIRALSSQALLARLKEHPQEVTIDKDKDVRDRHKSLRNTIEWSYNLLNAEEQQLLRRLSVFAGSCSLETVEAVCNTLGNKTLSVWEGIESLFDKSLLQAAEHKGEGRLRLLETIREYGLGRLDASEEADITRRTHANYYLTLVKEAEQYLKGEQQLRWLEKLEQELENLRAALNWFIEHEEVELALCFCGALWWFWRLHGYWSEGRHWLETALGLSRAGKPTKARAMALCAAGDLAYYQDDYPIARTLLEESVTLCRALNSERELATALASLGVLMRVQGELAAANPLLTESERLYRKLGSSWELSYLLRKLAQHAAQEGKLNQAVEHAQEGLALAKKLGDKFLIAYTLSTLGEIAEHRGDMTQAIAYNRESLSFARELGDKYLVATTLNNIGYFTALQGDLTLVTDALECLTLTRELGEKWLITKALHSLGCITTRQGNLTQAALWYREGLSLALELHNEAQIGWNISGLAIIAVQEGQFLQAARLFGVVETRLNINVDMNPIEHAEYMRAVESARTLLGKKPFRAARNEGLTLLPEQILVAPRSLAITSSPPPPKYPDGLTEREVQVLCLVADGLTDEEIAKRLVIAPRSVNSHLTRIYRKIKVSSDGKERRIAPRIAAALYVAKHDLC